MATQHLGRVQWRETMTGDVDTAKRFYGGLFGWTFENFAGGDPNDPYVMIKVGEKMVGGLMAKKPGMTMPSYWTSYVSVADVDASCAAAKAHGGSVPWGPVDFPDVGRMAMVAAKDGACLSLMRGVGDDTPPDRPGIGEFCWETLSAADVDEAKAFWTKVVPTWKAAAGANGIPTFAVGEGMENQVADLQPARGVPPNWFTYVVVEKIEPALAKAESLGGKTMMPAMTIPNVGRIAGIFDDQGAALGLFEPGMI
jgi:uncharacterized protein